MGSLPRDIQNVVWLQTSFIGDVILTTAAMQLLKRKAPAVRQYLITTPVGSQALAKQPLIQEIFVWDKRQEFLPASGKRLKHELGERGVFAANSVLLQAHKSVRSSLLRRLIGLPTVTYAETHLAFGAFQVPRVAVLHEAARIAMLLQPLGFCRKDILQAKPSLVLASPLAAGLKEQLEKVTEYPIKIGLAPGSVWQTKRWPSAYFAELVQDLLEIYPKAVILLLGASSEQKDAQDILERLIPGKRQRVIDLVGRTKLPELPAVYSQMDLLVSNDSSPIHYASAHGVPTVAIFGATVPAMGFHPLAEASQVAEIELSCRPCSDHGPKSCPLKHFSCMRDLRVSMVLSKAQQVLKAKSQTF